MLHHRSPTRTGYPSVHSALALRHVQPSIPTLLSPLRSIANNQPIDDFQSNAWLDASSYRPLAGLGITYLYTGMLGDTDRETHDTQTLPDASTVPYTGLDHSVDLGFDNGIDLMASDIVGLIPDVNMYDTLRRPDPQYPGVNPLDTIRSTPLHDIGISYDEPIFPAFGDQHIDGTLSATDASIEQSPSPRVIQDIMSILIQPAPEFSLLPWPSTNSQNNISSSQLVASGSSVSTKLEPSSAHDSEYHPEYPNTAHLSPVLNAHLGIELTELVSKAERFRTKHPERDIDRAWLSHFAGKLSERGELLNDFRCYVIGCDQRNKRRDHILVHVGAHIGQRPFACSMCPMRFLRKNECKRHEASHSGSRPYSCDICGQSFVRQDLVKRHVKRTHGLRDENQFGVAKQPRKKARLR